MDAAVLEVVVPGVVGLLLCGAGACYAVVLGRTARASRRWPTAPGRVVACSSKVVREGHTNRRVRVDVAYEFAVDGVVHRGTRVRFAGTGRLLQEDAARLVARYPVGARVTVAHAPGRPETAVLDTQVPRFVPFVLAASVLGGGAILGALWSTMVAG